MPRLGRTVRGMWLMRNAHAKSSTRPSGVDDCLLFVWQVPDGERLRSDNEADEKRLLDHLQDWRDAYAANTTVLDRKFPLWKFDATKPMRGIDHGLVRFTITDSFTLNRNHARDLFHAIASVRCAEMVTLDAHWTAQVRKLKLPSDFVQVYSESDFGRFLTHLESTAATR